MIKLQNIRSYLLDEQFKITIINNNVDIVNFTSIGHFDDTKIIVRYNNGSVVVKGEKLVVKKLLIDEILIGGKIKSIELINI
jgi:sporulation protein YqfC